MKKFKVSWQDVDVYTKNYTTVVSAENIACVVAACENGSFDYESAKVTSEKNDSYSKDLKIVEVVNE